MASSLMNPPAPIRTSPVPVARPLKILVVADDGAAKRDVLRRCTAHAERLELTASDGSYVPLQVEGTGNSRFRLVAPSAFREASALVLVADLGQDAALERLQNWMAVVHRHVPSGAPLALIGWKQEATREEEEVPRAISHEQAQDFTSQTLEGAPYLELPGPLVPDTTPHGDSASSPEDVVLGGFFEELVKKALGAVKQRKPVSPAQAHANRHVTTWMTTSWTPAKHQKVFPKEFHEAALLLLLNCQAHIKRCHNPAATIPPLLWEHVLSFCSPLWFFKDQQARAIVAEGRSDRSRSPSFDPHNNSSSQRPRSRSSSLDSIMTSNNYSSLQPPGRARSPPIHISSSKLEDRPLINNGDATTRRRSAPVGVIPSAASATVVQEEEDPPCHIS